VCLVTIQCVCSNKLVLASVMLQSLHCVVCLVLLLCSKEVLHSNDDDREYKL